LASPWTAPRHIWWNFVSSRKDRIEQAKAEWKMGRFAVVPGDSEFIPLAMTLNILGIAVEDDPPPTCKRDPINQFWIAASEVFTEIVKRRPDIQEVVGWVIDAGGDIEITAHNQAGKISLTLADSSGDRQVVLEDARQLLHFH
jgi:hypothetical protein